MQRICAPDFYEISTLSLRKKNPVNNWKPVQRRLLIVVRNCFAMQ